MATTNHLTITVIVFTLNAVTNINEINAVPSTLNSFAKFRTNESNIDVHSDLLVPEDFNNSRNSSVADNLDHESAILPRSGNNNDDNLITKLNDLSIGFKNMEKTLKDLQAENKKFSSSIKKRLLSLRDPKGVYCNGCMSPMKFYPKDCKEVLQNGNKITGIYEIFPKYSMRPFPVMCDMEINGGGWIHIQKRFDGSQDFFLGWRDYKFGFGTLEGEFWLGLEKIHLLTGFESTELLVQVVDRNSISAHAHYSSFEIGAEPEGYKLKRLSGYSGDAGDSLEYHREQKFSTKDLDINNCATKYFGAWWYKNCTKSNLNGRFLNMDLPKNYRFDGLHWDSFRGPEYSHSQSRMLVRHVH